MKFYKKDVLGDVAIANLQAQVAAAASATTSSSSVQLERVLWGNADDGSDMMDTMFVNGSIYLSKGTYYGDGTRSRAVDDDDDDDEEGSDGEDDSGKIDLDSLQPKEDDGGGNLYTDGVLYCGKTEATESVYGKEIYFNYPTADSERTNLLDALKLLVPPGAIIMHNGSMSETELYNAGWQICNGKNGAPDLSDKFIKAVSSPGDVGQTGGNKTHTLSTDEMPAHTHTYWDGATSTGSAGEHTHSVTSGSTTVSTGDGSAISSVGGTTGSAGAHTHSISYNSISTGSAGSGSSFDIEPPYYTLVYIMRLN